MPKRPFALHSNFIVDASYRVRIDLNNSLTTWERTISKIRYSLNSRNTVWKPNFFPIQAMPKNLLLFTLITLVILHTEFGLIWTPPWPHERNIFKIRYSLNSQNFEWKPNFFPGQAIATFFLALRSNYAADTLYRVWSDFNNSFTRWKRHISKTCYSLNIRNNRKFPYEILTFLLCQLFQKFFYLHSNYTADTLYRVRLHLDDSVNRWKRPIFKIRKN